MLGPYWVTRLVGGSSLPSRGELRRLARLGIRLVVPLLEEWELTWEYSGFQEYCRLVEEVVEAHCQPLPTPDGSAPDLDELLALFKVVALEYEGRSRRVLFHCYSGVGRTPTVLTAYLITVHGLSLEEAWSRVRSVNPEASLSPEQAAFLDLVSQYYRGALSHLLRGGDKARSHSPQRGWGRGRVQATQGARDDGSG